VIDPRDADNMAKQGDEVPIVLEVRSATASDEHEKYAGFSLRTTQGETNFCISFPHLGILVTQALQLSQQHAKELNRPVILGGAVTAIDIIPESIAVSFQDVDGNRQRRLVVMIGDFCLSLQVDDELLAETLQGLSGPATPLVKRPAVSFPIDASGELKIPTHRTAKTPYETSALPVKWAPYAGFITVLWGHFETRLVELTNLLMLKNMTAPVIRRDRKKIFLESVSCFWPKRLRPSLAIPTLLLIARNWQTMRPKFI
jgi:hypothetical protein